MNRDSIESLHHEASDHYVQGNLDDARRAWERVLEHDPDDARAREGLRLCDAPTAGAERESDVGETTDDVLGDLELDLDGLDPRSHAPAPGALALDASVLDTFAEEPAPAAEVPIDHVEEIETVLIDRDDAAPAATRPGDVRPGGIPDPDRQGEGIDLGDIGEVETLAVPDAPPIDPDAVDQELHRRTAELLGEARAAHAEGRDEDALTLLARLAILDDTHEGARELDAEIRDRMDSVVREIDDAIGEAVAWLESGRYEEARDRLREVLERAPDHREAAHLLEEAEERLANAEEIEVGPPADGAPSDTFDPGDVDLDPGTDASPELLAPVAVREAPEPAARARPVVTPMEPAAAGRRRPSRAMIAGAAVVALAALAWFGRGMLPGSDPAAVPTPASTGAAAAAQDDGPEGAPTGSSTQELIDQADRLAAAAAPVAPSRAAAERLADSLAAGRRAMESGDWEAAILAYNEALEADPVNGEAAAGLLDAGARYRERKAQDEDYLRARRTFAGGDYASALRILYRLPEDLHPAEVRRMKVDGWFNLGLVELRAGDLDEATGNLREALALDDGDAGARRALAFADGYRDRAKDGAYYAAVQAMEFRGAGD